MGFLKDWFSMKETLDHPKKIVETPIAELNIEGTLDPLVSIFIELKARYEAKLKDTTDNLTQPEYPISIEKIEWDELTGHSGYRIFYETRYVEDYVTNKIILARGTYEARFMTSRLNDHDIKDIYKIGCERDLVSVEKRDMSGELFPSFEIAEKWLQAYLHGPQVTRFSKEGLVKMEFVVRSDLES